MDSDHHTSHDNTYDEDGYFVGSTSETIALGGYVQSAPGSKIGAGCSYCMQGNIGPANARWIAALSPAIAEPIERWLRDAAEACAANQDYWLMIPTHIRAAADFAVLVLEEVHDG